MFINIYSGGLGNTLLYCSSFLLLYLLLNVLVGIWAFRRIHNTNDYLLAGQHLSFPVATAVVYTTWFNSETILSASFELWKKV